MFEVALGSILIVAHLSGCGGALNCNPEGEIYSAHELNPSCCHGLTNVNLMFEPSDDYEGDDLPDGCGVGDAPPSIMICIACGDGTCGESEHHCNCPEDCAAP